MSQQDDPLAYGDYHERGPEGEGDDDYQGGERGFIGDTYRRYRDKYRPQQGQNQGIPPNGGPEQSGGLGSSLFDKIHGAVHDIGSEIGQRLSGRERPQSSSGQPSAGVGAMATPQNRYGSFAVQRYGNDAKWYVDGCGYMWAVSIAIEQARESIWILDCKCFSRIFFQRRWSIEPAPKLRYTRRGSRMILINQGWLSPELYLRRPPSRNEQYRIDRMLQAAAQRGVKVNIIVYKEVTQALTRKYLTPILPRYLHSLLPHTTDPITKALSGFGLAATFAALEHVEAENPLMAPILTVSSSHTKHHLENLHPNISVFRHPDHLPDAQTLQSSFLSSLQNLSLTAKAASTLPEASLKAIYGMNNDIILYWAHHEKLCLIDGKIAFMGGLDLCFGRWDTNQHPIADAHPSDLNNIVFPGQDFNNARIMDFQDVAHPDNNKLDRKTSSRMGWSDISISLHGPVVEDLKEHFAQRWNFIYNEKYDVRKDTRYSRITLNTQTPGALPQQNLSAIAPENRPYQSQPVYGQSPTPGQPPQSYQPYQAPMDPASTGGPSPYQPYNPSQQRYDQQGSTQSGQSNLQYGQSDNSQYGQPYQPYSGRVSPNPAAGQQSGQYFPPPPSSRGIDGDYEGDSRGLPSGGHHYPRFEEEARELRGRFETKFQHMENRMEDRYSQHQSHHHGGPQTGGMPCQIIRSCSKWSHGVPTEHSIQNAYCDVIRNSQHFVYIENQFFITATSDKQKPIKNMIGAAIVERIIRAARAGEKYKVIVVMPAIPAFAGDLKDDASLGTRAIMEFQYNSINRGGYSIMESIANAGFDPTEYIRFYNLRNYDRINASAAMSEAQRSSGIDYEDARRDHDAAVELPAEYPSYGGNNQGNSYGAGSQYQPYQQAATNISNRQGLGTGRWDSVSECYMLGGADIRSVPWENGELNEIDAFVSEELYVHSKVHA